MVGKIHHEFFQVTRGKPALVPPAAETNNNGSVLYFLSNVDDDLTIIRTLYCFKSGGGEAVEVIRNALSKVLVNYYPLAGRVVVSPEGGFAVNCTGEGAVFVEAEAGCRLDDVDFSKPDRVTRGELAVFDAPGFGDKFAIPLMVQVTQFSCGGFVLGISFNHVLADGQAAMEFIAAWAETARGLPISAPPFLDRTILRARTPLKIEFHHSEFDAIEIKPSTTAANDGDDHPPIVYKYLKFTPEMIQAAKSQTNAGGALIKPCSTYEALSAFAWRARTRALRMAPDQMTRILLVVNTRERFAPPLPKGYFGNAIKFTPAHCSAAELVREPLSYAVMRIREAVGSVDDAVLRSTIDYCEATRAKRPRGYSTMTATTWSRLVFSAADFGWGEPVLSEPAEIPSDDTVVFLSHPTERGSFNVFVALPAPAMEKFEELVKEELCSI